ncbi:MAG: transglutaminase domain-containing protein, partial [Caulobacteraceae bacterium]
MRWKTTTGLASPAARSTPVGREAVVDLARVTAPKAPRDAPPRFSHPGQWEMSDFADWAQVSALVAPLYAKAAALALASPLKAEAARIAAATPDPKARAGLALQLVQKQIRYLFLAMNLGGYTPADADVTWARRFGDCKGKTVLLLALLRQLGIEAEPALVSTAFGDGMDERVPMLGWFDHVLVRATIGGKPYWLDGTRLGDRDIDAIPAPGFRWALPVRAAGASLEKIDQPPFDQPRTEVVVHLDATGGLDRPAAARAEEILRGDSGQFMHLALASLGDADARRDVREFWRSAYPWITAADVGFNWDEASGVTRLTMTGAATMDWVTAGASRQFRIGESGLGADTSFKREPGPDDDAPFAVTYPAFDKWSVTVALPDGGDRFRLGGGADVDRTIAGVAYQRRSRLQGGVVTMVASTRAVVSEFPFSRGVEAQAALRDLAASDVVI